jgi:hypothetical protein
VVEIAFFLCAGCKGGGRELPRDIAASAGGAAVGWTGGENSASPIAEGDCGAGCGAEGTPPGGIRWACVVWMTTFKPLSIYSASCLIPRIV